MNGKMDLKPLRVLSIDWDYFVDASIEDRYTMFPDGGNEDIGTKLISYIWACRYGQHPIRESVKVDKPHLLQIKRILSQQAYHPKVMIADSHKWAYTFIKHSLSYQEQPVEVYNVDFHHDLYGDTNVLDCGSWLRLLQDDCNSSAYWIAREDSEVDGVSMPRLSMDELETKRIQYDLIFFCRSGVWSPPHLDRQFLDMVKPYKNQTYTSCPETWVYEDRDSEAFKACSEDYAFVLDSTVDRLHLGGKNGGLHKIKEVSQ